MHDGANITTSHHAGTYAHSMGVPPSGRGKQTRAAADAFFISSAGCGRDGAQPSAGAPRGSAGRSKPKRPRALQIADKPSPSGGFLFFNGVMLKTPMPTQHELEMVTLEELVPK
ncbi:hypothetical protein, partial [Burkholderia pseudomallei]